MGNVWVTLKDDEVIAHYLKEGDFWLEKRGKNLTARFHLRTRKEALRIARKVFNREKRKMIQHSASSIFWSKKPKGSDFLSWFFDWKV
jgi:hypothetical protein